MFKNRSSQRRTFNSRGFSVIELLIAVTMSAVVVAAVYSSFIIQQRSMNAQDLTADTNSYSKVAFNMMIDDIREAGFGFPGPVSNPNVNGLTQYINVSDSGTNGGPDAVTVVGGFRDAATLAVPTIIGTNQIQITYIDNNPVFNTTDRSAISIDGVFYAKIISCTTDTNGMCSASALITLDRPLNKPIPAARRLYVLEDRTFCVTANAEFRRISRNADVANCAGTANSNTETLAENINDLQFAYAVDANGDGRIDDQNGNSTFDTGDYLNPPLPANSTILAVRTSILAATGRDDPNLEASTKPYFSTGITLENNNNGDSDRQRRTLWSMEVSFRNAI